MKLREPFTAIAIITVSVLLWNQFKPKQCYYSGELSEVKSMGEWSKCHEPPEWWKQLDESKRNVISGEVGV